MHESDQARPQSDQEMGSSRHTSTTPIPVTVDTFEALQKHEGLNVKTLTRMVALRRQKPRTLTTFTRMAALRHQEPRTVTRIGGFEASKRMTVNP